MDIIDEVGKEFLNKYGFFELIGPTGHFETSDMALYVNFLEMNIILGIIMKLKNFTL